MTLSDVVKKGFDKFCEGKCDSISILDVEGETIKVLKMDELEKIEAKYLESDFISIGSSSIMPTRLRIRINYHE